MNRQEVERRQTKTQAVFDLFRQHRGRWVDVHALAHVGGFAAWRTRVSQARDLCGLDEEIIWNGQVRDSCYMLRPKRLGRDAAERLTQKSLFG